MNNELQQQITEDYENYIKLTTQNNTDFKNIQKVIEDSDLMLNRYRKQYGDIIMLKNNEINQLQRRLNNIKTKNESLRKTLYNIPEEIRKKYLNKSETSF